jgi:hypothetical protein
MSERSVGRFAIALLVVALAALVAISADAAHRRRLRADQQPAIDAVARRLPAPDLALSGGARWLRSPALEEPGAAFAEGPVMPDADPAGGVMAPPRAIWVEEQVRR